ncbi:unnamed protein product [Arabidopsis lyrata]|uniref:Uncharacterized protein n=1 Tax=Arabidopsis lyrata subsp. lyrata TaxID=81972 RepID=D7MA96_ARALL|nr:hypothetical protein ARALYDRAFT_915173 [Arabidopsis lyrata subsp. lyrata]CAH8276477.1 unnamed protein product [Arabidopsis lyrata]
MEEEKLEIVGPLEKPLMGNIVPEEINGLDSLSLSPLALIALSLSLISFHRRGLAVLPANLFGRI